MAKAKDLQVNVKLAVAKSEEEKIKQSFTKMFGNAFKSALSFGGKSIGAFAQFNMGVKAFGDNVQQWIGGIMKYEDLVNKQASKADQRLKLLESLASTKEEEIGFMKLMGGFTGAGLSPEEVEKALSKFRESVASGRFKGTKLEGMNTMDMFMEFVAQVGQKKDPQERQKYIAEFIGTKQVALFEDLLKSSPDALANYNKMTNEEALKQIANMRAIADAEDKKDALRYQTDIKREQIMVEQGQVDATVTNEQTRLDRETRGLQRRTGQDLIDAQNVVNAIQDKQDQMNDMVSNTISNILGGGDPKEAIKKLLQETFNEILQGPTLLKWVKDVFTGIFDGVIKKFQDWLSGWASKLPPLLGGSGAKR